MYAIYGNIYHQYTPNVSIYTIHGSYGYGSMFWKTHLLPVNFWPFFTCSSSIVSEKSHWTRSSGLSQGSASQDVQRNGTITVWSNKTCLGASLIGISDVEGRSLFVLSENHGQTCYAHAFAMPNV